MLALVNNELIKLFYRKKIFIAVLIIIASAIVGVWGSIAYIKSVQPEEEIRSLQKTISQLQKEKSKIKDEVKKQKIDMQIYQLEQQLAQWKSALASDSNNWRENLKKEIKELKIKMNQALDLSFSDSKENYRKKIIENEYYLSHNLKPLKHTDLNNFIVMILFLGMIIFMMPLIVFVISSDIMSNEFSQKTIRILASQPIPRNSIVLSKFLTALIVSEGLILISEVLVYIVTGIIYGFTNLKYPTVIGTIYKEVGEAVVPVYGSSYIITLGKFLILALLLQALIIAACCALSVFISTLCKSNSLANILSFIVVYGIYFLVSPISQVVPAFKYLKMILLYSYLDPTKIITNDISVELSISFISPWFSILVIAVYLTIPIATALLNFKNKDILA
ncbi:hypothetical protein Calkr_2374 [Caldicellulosiruptor acetigenus I77R1B]|uniref:ABC-2 type transporter n=1 Tax=Caldicellulosiruptor acetigenus (strain ATCC 700853 / DSM 12137 / I77R1B) TaxID=632335 RepID=E4S7D4_CALA7|nr:ABC transporter permease subunit [Caldicellulosiruptor acetigenus]ADQ41817.1 hypothetical protein Calkr_2374 [Caldicellulosiruptor acetigenus I77R1B]